MGNFSLFDDPSEAYCEDIHNISSDLQCSFVHVTEDCHIKEGIFEYTIFLYCFFPIKFFPIAIIFLMLWLAFLFVALAVAASDFFCPSLIIIAKILHMSDNIAGITLLAFGNGAPDVFSAIAAVQNMKHGDNGLVFGALLGAGVFLTTVVVGAIGIVSPFKSMERPFLRDIIFYIITTFFTFYICFVKRIYVYEAALFIVGYIVYVVVVLVGRLINKRYLRPGYQPLTGIDDVAFSSSERQDFINSDNFRTRQVPAVSRSNSGIYTEPVPDVLRVRSESPQVIIEEEELPFMSAARLAAHEDSNEPIRFLRMLSPIDIIQWHNSNLFDRLYAVVKAPALFAFKITVPVVDKMNPLYNWNKPLNTLHCITSTTFGLFLANSDFALQKINGVFPVYGVVLMVGTLLAIVVWFTSTPLARPRYHSVFAFIGFIVAVLWIKAIACEIVNLLQAFGIVFSISNAILGLTLLAWGNSIGDFISDVSMARRGYPRAGFSACFGGPLFNTLLGIGIPFTIASLSTPLHVVEVQFSPIHIILFSALVISLVSSLVFIPFNKFFINRCYGIYLIVFYILFLIIAILVEEDVIKFM